MPEIMPFGRMKDLSVEQIALKDYKYFTWLIDKVKKHSLAERFDFVEYVANHFKSVKPCRGQNCSNTPRLISIAYNAYMGIRDSSTMFIYCSKECFNNDPNANYHSVTLLPLTFRTAISPTKSDTNRLVKVMMQCMGLPSGLSKDGLEKFFDNVQCW